MAYLVFARKYRPLNFDDVVGQHHITQTLCKAIEKDRVAHAYIFTGTRGVGKTTTARILARALNCEKGPTPAPCGVCDTCKQIIAGSSFDVLEIDGASNNSVDDIRELRENINYTSMGGKWRVFVIDEVHMLSKNAFNALLKTLEEPPPRVVFIFATTEPHRIPATIHSRCQRHDFRRISAEQIQGQLVKICDAEGVAYDAEALALVARKADGSMRDALSLLDQVHSYCHEKLGVDEVRSVLGLVGADAYARVMKAIHTHAPEPALAVVQDILVRGYDLSEFVVGLEEYVRDLILAHVSGASAEVAPLTRELSALFTEPTLLRIADAVRRVEFELRQSSYPRFLVETLLLKLVHMDSTVTLEQLMRTLEHPQGSAEQPSNADAVKKKALTSVAAQGIPAVAPVATPAVPAPVPTPAAVDPTGVPTPPSDSPAAPELSQEVPVEAYGDSPEDASVDTGDDDYDDTGAAPPASTSSFDTPAPRASSDFVSRWPRFLDALREAHYLSLATFLTHAEIVSYTGTTLDIRFPQNLKFQFDELTGKNNRQVLERKLAEFAGGPIQLHITLDTTTAPQEQAPEESAVRKPAKRSIEDDIQNEPIIQTVLEVFDGQVLE